VKDAGGFAHIWAANLKMSSKSYRAILPPLSDDELLRLRAWSEEHCATSASFRDGGAGGASCVVWLATKERPRPREAFMRSIRGTLKRLGIDPSRLRGTWLAVTESNIVLQESRAARAECPVAAGPSTTLGIAQQGGAPTQANKQSAVVILGVAGRQRRENHSSEWQRTEDRLLGHPSREGVNGSVICHGCRFRVQQGARRHVSRLPANQG
jgi:hypothetical protein